MQKLLQLIEILVLPMPRRHFRQTWQPAVDVYRCQEGWVLKFDLAGMNPENVQVEVRGRQLTVSGVRRDWRMADSQEVYGLEIAYGHFERTVELPENIEQANVGTEYREGMYVVLLEMTKRGTRE